MLCLGEDLAELGEAGHARDWVLHDWLRLPVMNPLLFFVKVSIDNVNLSEGTILDLGSLFVRRTVLDVVQIVVVGLHADLAVGVLLIGDRLEEGLVVPRLDVVVGFVSAVQVFVVLSSPGLFDLLEILHYELLLCLGDAGTVPVRGHNF